jgi:formate hydrogenlyase subunit 4
MGLLIALTAAPFLLGVINRTKAVFAGRKGRPLLQAYYDIAKLLRKGAVYSRSTTWVFRSGPIVGLAAVLAAFFLVPFGGTSALLAFPADLVLFAYLLGLARFFTVLAALDTASSFEGMGASREVTFSALAEPALLLALAVVARETGEISLSGMFGGLSFASWGAAPAPLTLACAAIFVVLLAENARIPVDDPETHLELTMVHEVMVLDHSGPDLAYIQYGAALKFWVLGSLLVGILLPIHAVNPWAGLAVSLAGLAALALAVGIVESFMARLRLLVVPRLLLGAAACSLVALLLAVWS